MATVYLPSLDATATQPSGTLPSPSGRDRKSTRLNSSHSQISYAVFCLKKKNNERVIVLDADLCLQGTHVPPLFDFRECPGLFVAQRLGRLDRDVDHLPLALRRPSQIRR